MVLKEDSMEVIHICMSCHKSETCELWEQISTMDEDFVKDAYAYDPGIQTVGVTVTECFEYEPR